MNPKLRATLVFAHLVGLTLLLPGVALGVCRIGEDLSDLASIEHILNTPVPRQYGMELFNSRLRAALEGRVSLPEEWPAPTNWRELIETLERLEANSGERTGEDLQIQPSQIQYVWLAALTAVKLSYPIFFRSTKGIPRGYVKEDPSKRAVFENLAKMEEIIQAGEASERWVELAALSWEVRAELNSLRDESRKELGWRAWALNDVQQGAFHYATFEFTSVYDARQVSWSAPIGQPVSLVRMPGGIETSQTVAAAANAVWATANAYGGADLFTLNRMPLFKLGDSVFERLAGKRFLRVWWRMFVSKVAFSQPPGPESSNR